MSLAKNEVLKNEGDKWFERNMQICENRNVSQGIVLLDEFLKREIRLKEKFCKAKVLEIGCSFGYNLKFLKEKYQYECFGIDPSIKAIQYGNNKYSDIKIELRQGTADSINYSDDYFNIVILGFCMYLVDRNLLSKVVAEIDRILKVGGVLVITDFDTMINYKRDNIHNKNTPTYKMDYAQLFQRTLGYYLIEKRTYSDSNDYFDEDIQKRISTQILYKEPAENIYIFA